MKKTIKLFSVSILLMCALLVNAQDITTYKVKYEKYKALERTGNILLISGGAAIAVGAVAFLIGNKTVTEYSGSGSTTGARSEGLLYVGGGLICAGIITLIPGIIDKSVGKKKTREYKIRLDDLKTSFYYTPKYSGFRLTYRF